MHFLIRAAMLLAAGAAGWALAKRKKVQERDEATKVIYLRDEDAVFDSCRESESMTAQVQTCFRRMHPLLLRPENEASFLLENDTVVKLHFLGDGGLYLKKGDRGLLTWKDTQLIRFEKDNGDLITGLFYAPMGEANCDE